MNGESSRLDWIGFDLDHALCKYKLKEKGNLIQRACAKFLVEHKGWPDELLAFGAGDENPIWYAKGTIFDIERGNFVLALAEGGIIAHHGASADAMTPLQLRASYGGESGGEWASWLQDELRNFRYKESRSRILPMITYFDIPALPLMAAMVDLMDAGAASASGAFAYSRVADDVYAALNNEFMPEAFALRRGTYFPSMIDQTEKYVDTTASSTIRRWLRQLREKEHGRFCRNRQRFALLLLKCVLGPD